MKLTPKGMILKGYKATDDNMCCRGFKFEIGKWYEHGGDIEMCSSGFHFCKYPSGPWSYYDSGRLFEVEAEEAYLSTGPGADIKHVAKRIRLIKEIVIGGNRNTGDGNTGYGNTGDRNTGYGNTGDGNTGDGNTGDRNTGYGNAGDGNAGYRNAGNRNTGDRNTGYGNTGNRNTGDRNTGYGNAGDGNAGDYHSGCLCFGEAKFYLFNKVAKRELVDFGLVYSLSEKLMTDEEIDPTPYLSLPNASVKAIKKLHDEHKKARAKITG